MDKPKRMHRPIVLAILDGWGYSDQKTYNAIAMANTPHWDQWWANNPHTLLQCSGEAVGLPEGQMGNSEVGHMHIGAGRRLDQDLTRIDLAIANGDFASDPLWQRVILKALEDDVTIHILGLLSEGGVHSHQRHIFALLDIFAKTPAIRVNVHAFLDGRDTPPQSAGASITACMTHLAHMPNARFATLMGRYYAMDRDERWPRTERAYDALTLAKTDFVATHPLDALQAAYIRGEQDEFVQPTLCCSAEDAVIHDNDIVIFMNFRADRARQLTRALISENFTGFHSNTRPAISEMITLTHYADDIPATVAIAPMRVDNSFGEIISNLGLRQLRIAETEKYAHVTFFFNGGRETPFPGEERILVPSQRVATYDLTPKMSAPQITKELLEAIKGQNFDVIILNFANADMVGHSGNLKATIEAVECVDDCLGQIAAALLAIGGEMILTADHGNAELLFDDTTLQAHTAHTSTPVPFIYLGRNAMITEGSHGLVDISPTLLYLLGLQQPQEMTGHSIIQWTE